MKTASRQFTHHVSVPSNEGTSVDQAITINRPVSEVYSFWRQLENIPRFARRVESVAVRDDLHSHWVLRAPGGKALEWDAEIIEDRQNEMLSWRSAPGAGLNSAGSVWFTPVPNGQGTLVRVELRYVSPVGRVGTSIARILGSDADSEVAEDLRRLKSLLETGQLPEASTGQWQERVTHSVRRAANSADVCVRENAWTAVVCVAVTSFALGFILGRRRR